MNIYRVYPDDFRIGDTFEVIVVAENEAAAMRICEMSFNMNQGRIHVKEIDLNTEQIIIRKYFNG
jgi:hypothetical protein